MGLRLKFNFVLLLVCLGGFVASGAYLHKLLYDNAINEVKQSSKIAMEAALAVRLYTSREIKPLFDPRSGANFFPQGVPAFAATRTMQLFNEHTPGYRYREVALNPMNPKNKAQGWEIDIIQLYRSGKAQGELEKITEHADGPTLHLMRPFRIEDPSCLSCHSTPESAPVGLVKQYGAHNGFNWKLGEVIGAQIISIPASVPLERAQRTFQRYVVLLGGVFVMLFVALNVFLGRWVISPLRRSNALLEQLASEDALTGVRNRRKFLETLAREVSRAGQTGAPLSLVAFDLDHFKQINDTWGHAAGDEVLREVCRRTCPLIRGGCTHIGRLGGEEFALILPDCTLAEATALANRLRQAIQAGEMLQGRPVTASFGVAQWQRAETIDSLLARADGALYAAKDAGRNRVEADGGDGAFLNTLAPA